MTRFCLIATMLFCLLCGPALAGNGVDTGDNGHVWNMLHPTYKRLLIRGTLNGLDSGYMLYVSTLDISEECRPQAHDQIKRSFDAYVQDVEVKELMDFVDMFYSDERNLDLSLGKAVYLGIKFLRGD